MSEPFQKLPIKRYASKTHKSSAEAAFMKKFKDVVAERRPGIISSLSFCESKPDLLAFASSHEVGIFKISRGLFEADSKTRIVLKVPEVSATQIRKDGEIVFTGAGGGEVKAW